MIILDVDPTKLAELASQVPEGWALEVTTRLVRTGAAPTTGGAPALEQGMPELPHPALAIREADRTEVQRVEASLAEDGDHVRKVAEWAKVLCEVSGNELKRGTDQRAIQSHIPRVGPRRNAICITAEDLLTYLRTRERVLSGAIPQPHWWKNVYLGRPGRKAT